MQQDQLICEPCGKAIGSRRKFLAVNASGAEFSVRVACEHRPVRPEEFTLLLASEECAVAWLKSWMAIHLTRCYHA